MSKFFEQFNQRNKNYKGEYDYNSIFMAFFSSFISLANSKIFSSKPNNCPFKLFDEIIEFGLKPVFKVKKIKK